MALLAYERIMMDIEVNFEMQMSDKVVYSRKLLVYMGGFKPLNCTY